MPWLLKAGVFYFMSRAMVFHGIPRSFGVLRRTLVRHSLERRRTSAARAAGSNGKKNLEGFRNLQGLF